LPSSTVLESPSLVHEDCQLYNTQNSFDKSSCQQVNIYQVSLYQDGIADTTCQAPLSHRCSPTDPPPPFPFAICCFIMCTAIC